MVDNHLHHHLEPELDPREVRWQHAIDLNDCALRHVVLGLGSDGDGIPRQGGFEITAASEVMAVLALADSLTDLRRRLGRLIVGLDCAGEPVTESGFSADMGAERFFNIKCRASSLMPRCWWSRCGH